MNVFLGHIAVHAIPGRELAWLVIGLASFGGYAALLSAWLRARAREAAMGMAPGVGIGGIGLVRPQRDPRRVGLAHRHLGDQSGEEVLLVHGLGVTSAVWQPTAAALAGRQLRLLAPDLLGFGGSRRLGTSFEPAEQVAAVRRLLDQHRWGPATVVGHSWGCAIAVALAGSHRQAVRRLVLVNPPVFTSRREAVEQLAGMADPYDPQGQHCSRDCVRDDVPAAPTIEADGPAGTSRCARRRRQGQLGALLAGVPPGTGGAAGGQPAALASPLHPTTVVLGGHDEAAPLANVTPGISDRVDVRELPGGHALLLTHHPELAGLIAAC
ncbi:MAG: alpha/beta fold hydrolase [Egibacteraceae bacterium]